MIEFSRPFIEGAREYLQQGRHLVLAYLPGAVISIPDSEAEIISEFFQGVSAKYEVERSVADYEVRVDQQQAIMADLGNGSPVLLRGFWRTGQSTMLKAIAKNYGENNSVNLSFYNWPRTGGSINWQEKRFTREEIVETLNTGGISGTTVNKALLPLALLAEELEEDQASMFLSIEEIMLLGEANLQSIEALKRYPQFRLMVSAAIGAEFEDYGPAVFADFKIHYLRPLTQDEVGIIIRKPFEHTPITMVDDAVEAIFDFCGGWPQMIQAFGATLLSSSSGYGIQKPHYDLKDAESITTQSFEKISHDLRRNYYLLNALHNFSRIFHEALSEEQRDVLESIAATGSIPAFALPEPGRLLVDTGLIILDESWEYYQINGSFYRDALASGYTRNDVRSNSW